MEEFNQPGAPESWRKMDINLLMLVDKMRHRAGIPFKITSAYRDAEYNKSINGVENSSHIKGKALDIAASDSKSRYLILESAIHYGIQRIGIANSFIHIDIDDTEKPATVVWLY
tara:strand:- start:1384 stop:1725 length:342 start_codon:yes stop_codon:yes gene_type:complete